MTSSLRGRMVLTVLGVVAPIVAGLTFVLYLAVERAVWDAFDRDLDDFSHAVARMVEYDEEGYEFDLGERPPKLSHTSGRATYLQVWGPAGQVLGRSADLGDTELSKQGASETFAVFDGIVAGGVRARIGRLRHAPRLDPEAPPGLEPPGLITIVVARQTESTRALLGTLAAWFTGLGLITLIAASLAAWRAVARGLEPVSRLAHDIGRIDDHALTVRVPSEGLPSELRPVVGRLNGLLDRLEKAFSRERRFTADVAHELRTPLTVLHASLELALRRERPVAEYRATLANALATVQQTTAMVENLLMLARIEGGEIKLADDAVALHALAAECWEPHRAAAEDRGLTLRNQVDAALVVTTDREKLRLVLGNLLSNATEYTEPNGWIGLASDPSQGIVVEIVDSGPPIPPDQLDILFDRFWRGDQARTGSGVHCGIGLSLVRSLCECMGYTITVENRDGGTVAFVVHGPARTGRAPSDLDLAV